MAFAYTITKQGNLGDADYVTGGFTNSSSTGGAIVTGLKSIRMFLIQQTGTTVVADSPVYSDAVGTVTIKTTNNANGTWMAIGSR